MGILPRAGRGHPGRPPLWRIPRPGARSVCLFAAARRQAGHGGGLGHLAGAEGAEHFEHLAPGGERPAGVALVLGPRLREGDFLVVVVALAGGGVDLAAALALLAAVLAAAALDGDGDGLLAAVAAAPVAAAPVGDQDVGELRLVVIAHVPRPRCGCKAARL